MSLEKEVANELLNQIARQREWIKKLEACINAADEYMAHESLDTALQYDLARAALRGD